MNYYLEGYDSPELKEYFEKNPSTELFVRELNHTFGLKVHNLGYPRMYFGEDPDGPKAVGLCNHLGFHIGLVWFEDDEYKYYSTWYAKQRGNSDFDRRVLRSKKLSSVIATMKRNDVIPSAERTVKTALASSMNDVVEGIRESVPNSNRVRKSAYDVDADVHHALLKIVLNGASQDLLMRFDRTKLQKVLDNWNEADRIVAERDKAVHDKMYREMYAIGVTNYKDYQIIKYKATEEDGYWRVVVESAKRVKSLSESFSEVIPLLTMYKVSSENNTKHSKEDNNDDWYVPRATYYDVDFDMAFSHFSARNDFIQWVMIPCSGI